MEQTSDREQRQLRLMVGRIQDFRDGKVSIGPVINDLEALLYELEEAPEPWKADFREEWFVLEISYAVALDRQQPLPGPRDHDILEALDRMEQLVRSRLDSE